MSYENVVPIVLRQEGQEQEFDGSGFIARIKDNIFFITCAHNIVFEKGRTHHFVYRQNEILIDQEVPGFRMGSIEAVDSKWVPGKNYRESFEPDYLLQPVPEDLNIGQPLEIRSTQSVGLDENLTLVTHDLAEGEQIEFDAKRSDNLNYCIRFQEQIQSNLKMTNFITLDCEAETQGYSGGAVIDDEKRVIGFLCRGGGGKILIFKIQDLPNTDD